MPMYNGNGKWKKIAAVVAGVVIVGGIIVALWKTGAGSNLVSKIKSIGKKPAEPVQPEKPQEAATASGESTITVA